MKLSSIEFCGFRGFRDLTKLEFGSGFTIINGRNGAGKSTICDAVEFVLTGSISKYTIEQANKENIQDYLWWRGKGEPDQFYVKLELIDDGGEIVSITRDRDQGCSNTAEEIERMLCTPSCPKNAIEQLCKTSLIRDELIASLSIDISETERFSLVKSALGVSDGVRLAEHAKTVITQAVAALDRVRGTYEALHEKVSRKVAEIASAKNALSNNGDLAQAIEFLTDKIQSEDALNLNSLVQLGQRLAEELKKRIFALENVIEHASSVFESERVLQSEEILKRRAAVSEDLAKVRADTVKKSEVLEQLQLALKREEAANAMAASLALLVEHGERLGLNGECCPLCDAKQNEAQFEEGVAAAKLRIAELSEGIQPARTAVIEAKSALAEAIAQVNRTENAWSELEAELSEFGRQKSELDDRLSDLGFAVSSEVEIGDIVEATEAERISLHKLESSIAAIKVSQTASSISKLEAELADLMVERNQAGVSVEEHDRAVTNAKQIEKGIRRVSAEIIDERLSQMSPLLNEFYQRLRPHVDWKNIDYSIRGDVRRFLSLQVGEGLNPQFVFSSGQRRAAGIAFLLSVYVARSWARFNSLILDDPIQHIDDYRSLQIAEVLSALRFDGHQIVCALEDKALADLFCRRLVSDACSVGVRYEIAAMPEGVSQVVKKEYIYPHSGSTLKTALRVVG
ncbi:RecF/RecN/SMC N terminal domain-containing protein [Thalassospira xiamenensis M-5 = DSM 17429]|uniref:SMC domain-containing protein n=1 Tax=Thalassospira xiamenensis M-5 = DSM 17429 TaxID=1123366 RepID=A0AB72U817_9PROT|nr:AAA family ATPase [Thalassospira xiamenensis]AJD50326.1 SMC domain-containing protein [Thalassospira xiamenensis M-5 = DSM 17429]SIS81153.1 RecF/RecN/SMC N terminal domain-containing protein [Thalassospira xiamenensis M-5 = DSM 17429]